MWITVSYAFFELVTWWLDLSPHVSWLQSSNRPLSSRKLNLDVCWSCASARNLTLILSNDMIINGWKPAGSSTLKSKNGKLNLWLIRMYVTVCRCPGFRLVFKKFQRPNYSHTVGSQIISSWLEMDALV